MMVSRLLIVAAIALGGGSSHAQEAGLIADVKFGWSGLYRPLEWMPVEVRISGNVTSPVAGTVTLSGRQDDLTIMNVSQPFVYTPGMPVQLPMVIKLADHFEECVLEITDDQGKTLLSQKYETYDYQSQTQKLDAVSKADMLVGVIGPGGFNLVNLGDSAKCLVGGREEGRVRVGEKTARLAPWDWTGYAGLDVLVLYNPHWGAFTPAQSKAVADYISNGGRAVFIFGGNTLIEENPIAKILPVRVGESLGGTFTKEAAMELGLAVTADTAVTYRLLTARRDNPWGSLAKVGAGGLFASGPAGFGRVAVVGLDPAQLGLTNSHASTEFWVSVIKSVCVPEMRDKPSPRTIAPGQVLNQPLGHYYQQELPAPIVANNQLIDYFYDIPEMRPLSIWWVITPLALLAILLGPVDYLILKRVDRLPLTWMTSITWIGLFTFGAFHGVQYLRGGLLQMRSVSVQDGIAGGGGSWKTLYCGTYAPHNGDYAPTEVAANSWWSALTPVHKDYYYRTNYGNRNVYYRQRDGGNAPDSVPISIWTIQCMMSEGPDGEIPVAVTFRKDNHGATVEIYNHGTTAIQQGYVMTAPNRGLKIDRIEAGERKEFSGSGQYMDMWSGNTGELRAYGGGPRAIAGYAQGSSQRNSAMQDYCQAGAAVAVFVLDNKTSPLTLRQGTFNNEHTEIVRLVVFPDDMRGQQ